MIRRNRDKHPGTIVGTLAVQSSDAGKEDQVGQGQEQETSISTIGRPGGSPDRCIAGLILLHGLDRA